MAPVGAESRELLEPRYRLSYTEYSTLCNLSAKSVATNGHLTAFPRLWRLCWGGLAVAVYKSEKAQVM